jgi:hypothetical protein
MGVRCVGQAAKKKSTEIEKKWRPLWSLKLHSGSDIRRAVRRYLARECHALIVSNHYQYNYFFYNSVRFIWVYHYIKSTPIWRPLLVALRKAGVRPLLPPSGDPQLADITPWFY